jgi:hypothetical protein
MIRPKPAIGVCSGVDYLQIGFKPGIFICFYLPLLAISVRRLWKYNKYRAEPKPPRFEVSRLGTERASHSIIGHAFNFLAL